MKKILTFTCVLFCCTSCIQYWDSLNVKNNNQYVVSSACEYKDAYLYGVNPVGNKKIIFDAYSFFDTAKYSIGDTLVVKIYKK